MQRVCRRPSDAAGHYAAPRVFLTAAARFTSIACGFDAATIGVSAPPKQVRALLIEALRAEGLEVVMWQSQPVPGQTLFRDKTGFGHGVPWSVGIAGLGAV